MLSLLLILVISVRNCLVHVH